MAKRSESQIIGDSGAFFVAYEISRSGEWIANPVSNDFGLDVEAILTESKEESKSLLVTNHSLKLQVKTSTGIRDKDGYISYSSKDLTKEYIMQNKDSIVPVLFAVVQIEKRDGKLSTKEIYYVDIIKWIEDNSVYLNKKNDSQIVTLKIPCTQTLMSGLKGELKDLAKEKPIRKEKLINDIISSRRTDEEKGEALLKVLSGRTSRSGILETVKEIEKVIDDNEGDEILLEIVYKLKGKIEVYSNLLNTEELKAIWLLAEREPKLIAIILGIFNRLYTTYPYVTRNLKLPDFFNSLGEEKFAYYCALREKYIDVNEITILVKIMNGSFAQIEKFNHEIKIPVGSSTFLDIIYEYEEYGTFAIYKQIEKF